MGGGKNAEVAMEFRRAILEIFEFCGIAAQLAVLGFVWVVGLAVTALVVLGVLGVLLFGVRQLF